MVRTSSFRSRVLQEPASLSAKILKAVYFPDVSILEAELGPQPSQVWRAILDGRDILAQGIVKRIGDGASTKIWTQNWIPREGMLRPVTSLVPHPPHFVSELIDATTATWREEHVRETFLPFDADAILRIPLCTRRVPDFWAWQADRRGIFSVRSAYKMLITTKLNRESWLEGQAGPSDIAAESSGWTSLWKIQVPSKLKVFVWRLAQHSLPTVDLLHYRNMSSTCVCTLCRADDSWCHALLNCAMARSVWSLSSEEMVEHMCANQESNAKIWLFAMYDSFSHVEFVRMVVTLWAIWSARRKVIHEEVFQSPLSMHCFILSFLSELQVLSKPPASTVRNIAPRTDRWLAPPGDLAKVNADAAVSRHDEIGAVGALCRDHLGNYLRASAVVFRGMTDPVTLEAFAVREALALADDLYVQRIHVASDYRVVVDDIKQGSSASYGAIIHEIRGRSSAFSSCNFVHEFTNSSYEAHNLAKHALSLGVGRHVWLGQPYDPWYVPVNIETA